MLPLLFPQNSKTPLSTEAHVFAYYFTVKIKVIKREFLHFPILCHVPTQIPLQKGCIAQLLGMCLADSFQLLMISVSTSAFKLRPWAFSVACRQWQSKVVGKDLSISIQGGTPLMSDLNSRAGQRLSEQHHRSLHHIWWLPLTLVFSFYRSCSPIIPLGSSFCLIICFLENLNPWKSLTLTSNDVCAYIHYLAWANHRACLLWPNSQLAHWMPLLLNHSRLLSFENVFLFLLHHQFFFIIIIIQM